jgi:PIN domain nuclease of toxin-antitoxin system
VAALIYLDTHVVAWLYGGRVDLLPDGARNLLNSEELLISPAVVLELQYLFEIRRTAAPAGQVVEALAVDLGLKVCDLPFAEVARAALGQSWTRDPFDRLIAGQAQARPAPLLTRDETILQHCPQATWPKQTPPAD